MSFLMVLWENQQGAPPTNADILAYAEDIGEAPPNPGQLLASDLTQQSFDDTPYDGSGIPGKCVLSPEMEIIDCRSGHGNTAVLNVIRGHAESQ